MAYEPQRSVISVIAGSVWRSGGPWLARRCAGAFAAAACLLHHVHVMPGDAARTSRPIRVMAGIVTAAAPAAPHRETTDRTRRRCGRHRNQAADVRQPLRPISGFC